MLRKIWRLLVKIVGTFSLLVLLGCVGLLVRLSRGPLSLDFLTSRIEQALYVSPAFETSVGHVQLVWKNWKHPFDIELLNFQVHKKGKPEWLKIDHVGISLMMSRLLVGEVAIKHVRLYHPCIGLERDERGKFSLGFEESGLEEDFSFEALAPLLALGRDSASSQILKDVRKLSVVEACVVLKDVQTKQTWELPKVTFTLRRYQEGFQADLTFLPLNASGHLNMQVSHDLDKPEVGLSLDFQNITLQSLIKKDRLVLGTGEAKHIAFDEVITFFQHWNTPLYGKAKIVLIPQNLGIISGQGNIDFGKGTLDLSVANLRPLPIEAGNLSFSLSEELIDISNLSLLSGDMLMQFSGKVSAAGHPLSLTNLLAEGQQVECRGKVEDLPLDHLGALWPQNLAVPAREWLTSNVRKGVVSEATLSLEGRGVGGSLALEKLEGAIKGKDAEVTYLEGLPPVQHMQATATFNQKGFDIHVTAGDVSGVKIQEGHILIKDLDTDNEYFILDTKGKGSLSRVLTVLENKPFEYATYADIDPSKLKGEGNFSLHMEFPLRKDLTFKHIKMGLQGTCKNVQFERRLTKDKMAYLTQGAFSINLTQDDMQIQGTSSLNGLPASLTYRHFFTSKNPQELQIQVEAQPSFIDLKHLGVDFTDYGEGSVKTRLLYTLGRDKNRSLRADFDATMASLVFPPLKWEKKIAERAHLSFNLILNNEHLSRLTDLNLSTPLYSLKGGLLFNNDNTWKSIHISELKGPFTSAQVTIQRPRENMFNVSLEGKCVNVEKVLHYLEEQENTKDYEPTEIKLLARVGELRLGEGRVFQNVQATADVFLKGKKSLWKEVKLQAYSGQKRNNRGFAVEWPGGVLFSITPGSHNTQILTAQASNAGQFLRNLGIYDNIQGGTLLINAVRKPGGAYRGIFKIESFDAHRVPLIARFAAVLSPMGIANLFSEEESLSMEKFKCRFAFDDNFVSVEDGVGKSMSLGFTVKGKMDRKKSIYALQGNIIPARFINSFINNIPIIGTLLSGGKGEGLFGISYTISGPFDTPNISVNPLSILAPGFLRNIFSGIGEE